MFRDSEMVIRQITFITLAAKVRIFEQLSVTGMEYETGNSISII